MEKDVPLTRDGYEKLKQTLEELETVKRREVADRIREAREFGDISENSEYDDAKNEQAWVESRIMEITQILARATIIDSPKSPPSKVALGCHVEIQNGAGEVQRYQVVGSAEADPANNKISNESPVGQAIIGRKKGDKVSVTTPSGKILEYTILSIRR
jgi:transcription elongation factor GreA